MPVHGSDIDFINFFSDWLSIQDISKTLIVIKLIWSSFDLSDLIILVALQNLFLLVLNLSLREWWHDDSINYLSLLSRDDGLFLREFHVPEGPLKLFANFSEEFALLRMSLNPLIRVNTLFDHHSLVRGALSKLLIRIDLKFLSLRQQGSRESVWIRRRVFEDLLKACHIELLAHEKVPP